MNIKIHRGTHQIGGCVTEYEHDGWHLFVDYGASLPGAPESRPVKIEELKDEKSALLITHYHGDHIGHITSLPEKLPIYIGKVARQIQFVLSERLHQDDVIKRLEQAKLFDPGKKFTFGPFEITPVTVDHSAFDAYAFKIVAGNVSAFHTGDFRTHGFRSGKMPEMINKFIGEVDYVVCEATNARGSTKKNKTERDIQKEFEASFKKNKGNIVYASSTNIDRLFSLYHAALRTGRPFYVDEYQKQIMDIIAEGDSLWSKSKLYQYGKYEPIPLMSAGKDFKVNDKFIDFINLKGYVLAARSTPQYDNFIEKLPGEKKKYLSMWEGYVKEGPAYSESMAKSLGSDYEYIHTSGHCDMDSMREFLSLVNPRAIIPIHTDDPKSFAKLFQDEWPVILLNDGDTFSPLSPSISDATSADVLCVTTPEKGTRIVNKEDGATFWGLERRHLGLFKNIEEAKFVISHTSYKPETTLGYMVDEEEDSEPCEVQVYDPEMNLLATHIEGGHQPGGDQYQQACRFAPGEKVLAVFQADYYAVVPSIVVGPVTPQIWREKYENDEEAKIFYSDFEEYQDVLYDWDWDSVAVHPLVKLACMGEKMMDTELVPRVKLFPYRDFKEFK
ncbi:MAG: hypothetical protein K6A41_09835 [Bacteroidales bacterium]|nr:hypothetical protein [Bacteroidales bacterium]